MPRLALTEARIFTAADAAREPVELWEFPTVHHTAAIRERSAEYERRVAGHFDRALLGR